MFRLEHLHMQCSGSMSASTFPSSSGIRPLHPVISLSTPGTEKERSLSAIEQPPPLQSPPPAPPRRYLFGPGPSMVHPRVYEALAKPIVGHLDAYFIQVMGDVQQLLKTAYGTSDGATLTISGTGSAGMEAAVANFVEPGAKVAVFANGYFSDRLTQMANRPPPNPPRFHKPRATPYP